MAPIEPTPQDAQDGALQPEPGADTAPAANAADTAADAATGDTTTEPAGDPAEGTDGSGDEQAAGGSEDNDPGALTLTVEADGSISEIAGGPLEEPVNTGPTEPEPADEPEDEPEDDEPKPAVADTFVRSTRTGNEWAVTAARAQELVDTGEFVPVLADE